MQKKYLSLNILKKSFLPLIFFILVLLSYFLFTLKIGPILNERHQRLFGKAFLAVAVLTIAFFLQRIAQACYIWYAQNIAVETETKFDDEFTPLLKRITNIVIWLIAGLVILSNFGVNINAVIATLGVGSLAVALAAQDAIANIIAGFLIMIDRPFRLGDEIKLPSGEKVKVLDIGIRRSRFINPEDNSIIIVPNLELSKSKIVNFTYGKEREKT